jgi:hypothetical protein
VLVDPQLEHPAPKSIAQSSLNPISEKSTLMGVAFCMKSLSTIYWNPSISKTSSVAFGSSRAMASDGPPHPPEFKNIRMGETSFPLKYSAICFVAASVTSTIVFSFFREIQPV